MEETIKQLSSHKGVVGISVVTSGAVLSSVQRPHVIRDDVLQPQLLLVISRCRRCADPRHHGCADGVTVRSTLDPALSIQYAALACQLTACVQRAVRELDLAPPPEPIASGMPGLASALPCLYSAKASSHMQTVLANVDSHADAGCAPTISSRCKLVIEHCGVRAEVAAGPPDELQVIRLRSKKHEIMIAPSASPPAKQGYYLLIVVQDPVVE